MPFKKNTNIKQVAENWEADYDDYARFNSNDF